MRRRLGYVVVLAVGAFSFACGARLLGLLVADQLDRAAGLP